MKFIKLVVVFSLVFFISCRDKKAAVNENIGENEMLEEHIRTVEPIEPENQKDGIANGAQAVSNICNIYNYKEYIYDFQKVNQLIKDTGHGCYLPGVDFTGQDLKNAVFIKCNCKGAIFKTADIKETQFMRADLTNAVLEDTNYMEAYFGEAILTGATYNEYNSAVAWAKFLTGEGIRDPQSRGMRYVGN